MAREVTVYPFSYIQKSGISKEAAKPISTLLVYVE